jgi:type II secretory pathway pseudopilin PulG
MRKRLNIRRSFTLIEILTVVTITVLLMMLALPAFEKMTVGTGVDAAARAVGGQLRLARQYAITNREYVAVLLPGAETVGDTDYSDRRYVAFRACIVDSSDVFQDWIPNTKWEFVPIGAVIPQVSGASDLDDPYNHLSADNATTIASVPDADAGIEIRAIMFAPSGKLAGGLEKRIQIVEGAFAEGAAAPILRNTENHNTLVVDTYTGRVSYE